MAAMSAEPVPVSPVIPAYNHASYLEQAIESVLAQDYPQFGLKVPDDGSTDNTNAVLAPYTGRVHWETQPNAGQARTLNKGWRMGRGEILGYLSADDLPRPRIVRQLANGLFNRLGHRLLWSLKRSPGSNTPP